MGFKHKDATERTRLFFSDIDPEHNPFWDRESAKAIMNLVNNSVGLEVIESK